MTVFSGYTATLYTLAQISDVANQFLRHAAGLPPAAMPRSRRLLPKAQRWRLPR
jgi:hypothetical protein